MSILNPVRLYKDLDLGFAPNPITGDVGKKIDVNAVKQALKVLLLTSYHERLFHPEIGTPIRNLLFQPADPVTTQALRQGIERTIQNWEPRVQLLNLSATPDYVTGVYDVQISFTVVGIGTPVTFSIALQRLR